MVEMTPMMSQYRRIKDSFADSILFFRLGDFYEMFEKDAREVSSLLDLTLTQRSGVPMCGIPYHAASGYIARLLAAGKKVAICEQTTLPQPGKGLVRREVREVITPGTVLDDNYLARNANNYLVAIGKVRDSISLAYADLSTGEFAATSFPFAERAERLRKELHRLEPRELITQESLLVDDPLTKEILAERETLLVNRYPDWSFDLESCRVRLASRLGVANLKGFGLTEGSPEIVAAGVILDYLGETAKKTLEHVSSLTVYSDSDFVGLDEATQRNLELLANLQDGSRRYTLLEVLDQTRTSLGSRRLRRWIMTPLKDKALIERRLSAVDLLYHDQVMLAKIREILGRVLDLERLTARVAMERATAKDLLAVKSTLEAISEASETLGDSGQLGELAQPIRSRSSQMKGLIDLLDRAIVEQPSILLTEGNLIKRGFDAELDRLHSLKDNARGILEEYLKEERAETGIASLKLRFNRILGYYFEVTKSNLSLVPPRFVRRQSLVGGERYTTDRLADLESSINDASERIIEIERKLFLEVRARLQEEVPWILGVCETVAELDVFQSFAFAATVHGYTRPRLSEDTRLAIIEGRHPSVEAHLPGGAFVPNSISLDGEGGSFVFLTGPNMAGKSTFLRQVALITLMAQIGSFVPASDAEIGLVDAIFCRVGATDNLARGESTFLVEMSETAHILRSATSRSLLIMDEIGRGTGTLDGLAIAWAVSMSVLERIGARTLFATHYHELTGLSHPRAANLSMDVLEREGEVVFLKRVREGPSANSYGIHVAKLAGIPADTLQYAQEKLRELSEAREGGVFPALSRAGGASEGRATRSGEAGSGRGAEMDQAKDQPLLFPMAEKGRASAEDLVLKEIASTPVDKTTPLEALRKISRWQERIGRASG